MKKTIAFGKISTNLKNDSTPKEPKATSSGFGTFDKIPQEQNIVTMNEILPEEEEESEKMKRIMGMSSFGRKAKSFDVQEMMENIVKTVNAKKLKKKT